MDQRSTIEHVDDYTFLSTDIKNIIFEEEVVLPREGGFGWQPKKGGDPVELKNDSGDLFYIEIDYCDFKENFILNDINAHITFKNCTFFKELNANDSRLKGKVRFRSCRFKGQVNLRNTKFEDLADFWRCRFEQSVTFYKTDFLSTTVFSAAIFNENVLFTYTLIDKVLILRGTRFKNGLDLSTAIIPGELSLFDIRLNDFNAFDLHREAPSNLSIEKYEDEYEEMYEDAINHNANIPIENKVETFRIIKKQLKDEGSSKAIDFNVLEKKAFKELINADPTSKRRADKALLWFNKWSSNYGKSYVRGAAFTVISGWLLFYPSILCTNEFEFSINPMNWSFWEGLKFYAQFLLPTHKFNYIEENPHSLFYLFDFSGRLFVSYGIYQTIQAFRKFK